MNTIKWTSVLFVGALLVIVTGFSLFSMSTVQDQETHDDHTATNTADARPLKHLMVGLGQDMSRVSDGVWLEDFVMIETAAAAIADHPKITDHEIQLIKAQLGDRFTQFVSFDKIVHGTAVELAEVAMTHNIPRILELQGKIAQACFSCHATFRTEVRKAFAADEVRAN